jgi:1,4-alpha-glucan branching enzyme
MVARLHAAGIEVILDVVYNHTGEGNETGPTLSPSAGSTTAATTGWRRTNATTSTTPAPATR